MSGEPVLVDNTGRTWPRITKDNAAQHPYPSLRHCKERGPGTAPYCWYLQISGEPTWDQEYTSFNKMKKKWDGWTGGNERRAQARRESAQQQETDRQGHRDSYRDAAAASRAATNAASTALLPHEEAQASILESRAGAMAATLLGAVGADGLVPFKPMVLGFERRRHEQLQMCPQLWGVAYKLAGEDGARMIVDSPEWLHNFQCHGPHCEQPIFEPHTSPSDCRLKHLCDGRGEADARDAAALPSAPRVPPISLPVPHLEDVKSRFESGRSSGIMYDAEAEAARQDWDGEHGKAEPFYAVWNGPKLDWPAYLTAEVFEGDPSRWLEIQVQLSAEDDASGLSREWNWLRSRWDDTKALTCDQTLEPNSIFADWRLEGMGGRGSEGLLPPWLLIRRVLAIMESRLQMHGRRLWWRSVFYAPPGFAKESDSRHVECNLALISHMQLAGLGERRFDKERAQYLGNELNLVGGMPLERQRANWHGWNGRWGEAFFSTGGSSSNFWNHYLFNSRHSIETPWWCPQRNQWIGHRPLGGCDTCVLPPNFALPYLCTNDGRTKHHILKALVDLNKRQGALCKHHYHPEMAILEHLTYDNYVHDCCRRAAEGPPSKWKDAERSLQEEMARRNPLRPSTSWQPRYGPTSCCGLEMRSATTDQPSWAFAAPGYCCDHWQLGRATMTVLGFRPVPGGETEQGITYAKWMQCSGERSSRQHASERISELHQHVILPSFDPNGESRVDRIARAVLNAPVPAVVPTLAAHSSLQCMECEE